MQTRTASQRPAIQADVEHVQAYLPIVAHELAAEGIELSPSARDRIALLSKSNPYTPPAPEMKRLELEEALREIGTAYSTCGTLASNAAVEVVTACTRFPCDAVRAMAAQTLRNWRRIAFVHVQTLTGTLQQRYVRRCLQPLCTFVQESSTIDCDVHLPVSADPLMVVDPQKALSELRAREALNIPLPDHLQRSLRGEVLPKPTPAKRSFSALLSPARDPESASPLATGGASGDNAAACETPAAFLGAAGHRGGVDGTGVFTAEAAASGGASAAADSAPKEIGTEPDRGKEPGLSGAGQTGDAEGGVQDATGVTAMDEGGRVVSEVHADAIGKLSPWKSTAKRSPQKAAPISVCLPPLRPGTLPRQSWGDAYTPGCTWHDL
jgi:hypothetical protein